MSDPQWRTLVSHQCYGSLLCRDIQNILKQWLENDPGWRRYCDFFEQRCSREYTRIFCQKCGVFAFSCISKHNLRPEKDLLPEFQLELIKREPEFIACFPNISDKLTMAAIRQNPQVFRHLFSPSFEVCLLAARLDDDLIAVMESSMAIRICKELRITKAYLPQPRLY